MRRMSFPATRLRRLRQTSGLRGLVRETELSVGHLVYPLFVTHGEDRREPVESMPGVERLSIDQAIKAAEEAAKLGIPALALFPYTDQSLRDETGSEALNPKNLICRAVEAIKKAVPEIGVMCDVALDPYTSHGHDGLVIEGEVDNDRSVEVLVRQALIQAEAGCDILAGSFRILENIDAMTAHGVHALGQFSGPDSAEALLLEYTTNHCAEDGRKTARSVRPSPS